MNIMQINSNSAAIVTFKNNLKKNLKVNVTRSESPNKF